MTTISKHDLYSWCQIPYAELERHIHFAFRFRLCDHSADMGLLMARELRISSGDNARGRQTRAVIPWVQLLVCTVRVAGQWRGEALNSLRCSTWMSASTGRGANCPVTIRTVSAGIWRTISTVPCVLTWRCRTQSALASRGQRPGDEESRSGMHRLISRMEVGGRTVTLPITRPRRHPFSMLSIEELRASTIRVQENNYDTIIALAQRTFGTAYQFVPPMSVTLGMKECLSAARVRLFGDTGAWKQPPLRVALFGPVTPEYPITLLRNTRTR